MGHEAPTLIWCEVMFTRVTGQRSKLLDVILGEGSAPGDRVTNFH
jgi:hypothetical protein